MKNLICATAISLFAGAAFAGGYEGTIIEPTVTPEVVIQDTVESSGSDDWVVAAMMFLTIVVAGLGSQ